MKFKSFLILISLMVTSLSIADEGKLHSHDGGKPHVHGHAPKKISQKKAVEMGEARIKKLISKEKINASWEKSAFEKAVIKEFKHKKEWVVTFTNENGKKGKKLYIFLSLSGRFLAANFSGN